MKSLFYVFITLFIFTILSSCAMEDSQVKGEIVEQGGITGIDRYKYTIKVTSSQHQKVHDCHKYCAYGSYRNTF